MTETRPSHKGTLQILLIEGRDLPSMDTGGFSDPYCIFKAGADSVVKSKVIKKSLNPKWDQLLTLPIKNKLSGVDMIVMDWDRFSADEEMGRAFVSIDDDELDSWYDLKKGSIHLSYKFIADDKKPKVIKKSKFPRPSKKE